MFWCNCEIKYTQLVLIGNCEADNNILHMFADIVIPGTNTCTTSGPQRIPAGEMVLVIKTPKGVYIRTNQGKIFAVRSAPKSRPGEAPESPAITTTTMSTSAATTATALSAATTTATITMAGRL